MTMTHPTRRHTDHPDNALMEANVLLRTVIDENPNIILMKDWDGKFLLGNRALASLYGTTPDALVGKDDGAFNPNAEQVAFYLENVRQVMASGKTQVVMEESTDTASGETLYYQSIKIPLTGANGKKQILVIANDVSELKHTEQRLEESERRLRYVLDATGEGVWDWDLTTNVVTHNRRWCQVAGLAEEYLTHQMDFFASLLHPQDRQQVMARVQACLNGQGRYQSEHRMELANGKVVWVMDRGDVVERDAAGKPLRMVGSFVDISERKAAEALVAEHAAQLDAMFELSPDGFVAFDSAYRVKVASPAFTRLTGLEEAQVRGLDEVAFSQLLATRCLPQASLPSLEALRSGGRDSKQKQAIHTIELAASGGRPVCVLSVGLRESQADSVSQILYLRDISHATEVDRLKSEFLSTAAHELRTPMASIYGFAEVLLTQKISAAERKEFLNVIFKQSELMASILNELLDLARIEARQDKDFVRELLSLQDLVGEVTGSFKLPAGRSAPVMDLPIQPVMLMADRKKASQAILNVLSNAYKYSAAPSPVHIRIASQGSQAALHVIDQGIGMTTAQSDRVGERFYRADASGKVSGTGLGMSIVTEIMALHQGSVSIESAPAQGTTVTLGFVTASVD